MKVIGFSCSPRKRGNTDTLVSKVLENTAVEGAETEFLRVADLHISPCDGCWTCSEEGRCHIRDDMQGLYETLLQSDAIVVGSPVHMGYSVSGHGQVFLDRTFALWHHKKLKNKLGGCVVASNRRGGINAIKVISGAMFGHHMIIAGYANGYGLGPGDIVKDERALREAANLAKRLRELWLLTGARGDKKI